jgi:hypothetical protein
MNDTPHNFHIPVMGTGFSIDTPFKVAKYGISSVISLVDDTLIEKMREFYCNKCNEEYLPITKYDEDFRARRITAYLNLIDRVVAKDFEELRQSPFEAGSEITKYFEMLPEDSPLKTIYRTMLKTTDKDSRHELQEALRNLIQPGSIDVNIMTKLDRANFSNKDKSELGQEFSDALSALRGYAQSTLRSSIVFSAGINQKLYSYAASFKDFYADTKGFIRKKIVLKVSDFRSSIIQGKFFAKKGLWVSEYRVESGLNCGGHAFATQGYLMGPILEEFKNKRQELIDSLHKIYNEALKLKDHLPFAKPHLIKITAQGGIGTAAEQNFLLRFFKLDRTGWATPFLLVPEATNVDEATLQQLSAAKEEDLYLSDSSPLGVPFNNLRNSQSETERQRKVTNNLPGSACPKGHLVSNTEFTEKPICTASRQYQKLKIDQLNTLNLPDDEYRHRFATITQKSCICHDLGEAALTRHQISLNGQKFRFTAICPGPNLAYFSKIATLAEMAGHIYGRLNLLNTTSRPNMFIKEFKLYVDYLTQEIKKSLPHLTEKQITYFLEFKNNLLDGIEYYTKLFPQMIEETIEYRNKTIADLQSLKNHLDALIEANQDIFSPSTSVLTIS